MEIIKKTCLAIAVTVVISIVVILVGLTGHWLAIEYEYYTLFGYIVDSVSGFIDYIKQLRLI